MAREVPIQASFARGEISPRLWSRVDLTFYRVGLERCENFVVLPHGGAARLPGTRFIGESEEGKKARLLSFEFNTEETYILEIAEGRMHFYRDRGQIFVDQTDAVVVNGNFDTDLSGWTTNQVVWEAPGRARFNTHGSQSNTLQQQITIDAQYVGEVHVIRFSVAEFAGGDVTFNVGTTAGGSEIFTQTLTDGALAFYVLKFTPTQTTFWIDFTGTPAANGYVDSVWIESDEPLQIDHPYREADLFEIHFTQSADTMYLAHKNHPPIKLQRFDNNVWTITRIAFTSQPSEWGDGKWPQRVGFFEDRLAWAAPVTEPQTIWLSKTGEFEDLTIGTGDDDGMAFTISAGQVNAIQWLAEDQQLQLGTTGATRTLAGAGIDAPLTPTSIKGKRHTTFGAAAIQPIQTGEITIYAGKYGRKLREFVFSFERDRFVSPDLTLLSEHLTRPGIVEMVYQQDPDSVIWMTRTDGQLIGLTYERDQEVGAFHRHKIAGGKADEYGEVESVAVIDGPVRDEVYLLVKRTINGATVRYIELLENIPEPEDNTDKEDLFFVHSGLSYDGRNQTVALTLSAIQGDITITAASDLWTANNIGDKVVSGTGRARITGYTSPTVVSATVELAFSETAISAGWTLEANSVGGMGHLEGETVDILADGAVMPPQDVIGGRLILPEGYTAARWQAGLGYTSILRTLRPEAGTQDGTAQGRLKRINLLLIRVRETLGMKFGRSLDDLDTIPFRRSGQRMDASPELYSGDLRVALSQGWGPDAQVYCVQDQPLPAEIQAISPSMETTEN